MCINVYNLMAIKNSKHLCKTIPGYVYVYTS